MFFFNTYFQLYKFKISDRDFINEVLYFILIVEWWKAVEQYRRKSDLNIVLIVNILIREKPSKEGRGWRFLHHYCRIYFFLSLLSHLLTLLFGKERNFDSFNAKIIHIVQKTEKAELLCCVKMNILQKYVFHLFTLFKNNFGYQVSSSSEIILVENQFSPFLISILVL